MNKFEEMYSGSYYTVYLGLVAKDGVDMWKRHYQDLLFDDNIGDIEKWVKFTGEEMNEYYDLTGKNAYVKESIFIAFDIKNLDIVKLSALKLRLGDKWFDDMVANALAREYGEYHYHDEYVEKDGRFIKM